MLLLLVASGFAATICDVEQGEISDTTIPADSELRCVARDSLRVGPNVTIEPNAKVLLHAPQVTFLESVAARLTSQLSVVSGPTGGAYEVEPNDSDVHANFVKLGQSVLGNIKSIADQDWYRIDTNAAGIISLVFEHPEVNYALNLYVVTIYDSLGNLIGSKDIYAPDEISMLDVSVGGAGAYYVSVTTPCTAFSGTCEDHMTDRYRWTGNFYPLTSPGFETEPNDNAVQSDLVPLAARLSAHMSGASDEDWFAIDVDGSSDVQLIFTHAAVNYVMTLWTVDVYDAGLSLVNKTAIYAPYEIVQFGFGVQMPGRYYVVVKPCQGSSTCETYRTDPYIIYIATVPN